MKKLAPGEYRPCKKCGVSFNTKHCKDCEKIARAAWLAKNPDHHKEWRLANPDKLKAVKAKGYQKNKVAAHAYNTAWKLLNPERCKKTAILWIAKNKEKMKETRILWKAANKDLLKAYKHTRRAKKNSDGGVLSPGVEKMLFKLQRGLCPCCSKPLGDDYHLDHKMPIALGGSNTDGNMQLLRKLCNLQKSSRHPVEFMQSRGFLL